MEEQESKIISCKSAENIRSTIKSKARGKKRKRIQCDSGSESDDGLPENALEVEKNLIASAAKNNLDDVSVKKILKKVVTNDHVLALVKLREEEESSTEENKLAPKLTRAKAKELNKVSPKTGTWNLQNLELTPIKQLPVKTRPEVKALIAQELPEDEDDEEYEPTHDDMQSDDDQCMESCSDLDSQPRTPATPMSQQKVVQDGPFKVPLDVSTPARRKLELEEEEATIALRTRSKLCLSETPIEHIESSFVPPDELPVPAVTDHIWNEFLNECLNPASVSKHEDDDETDPEYNVAADTDARDDDDELERSIIKISKKELNDLVTELFNIIPEQAVEDELANITDVVLDDANNQSTRWEGKQEPKSDEEVSVKMVDRIVFEGRNSITKYSVGKTEPADVVIEYVNEEDVAPEQASEGKRTNDMSSQTRIVAKVPSNVVDMELKEGVIPRHPSKAEPPASVLHVQAKPTTHNMQVLLDNNTKTILPEQIEILQQQLRQHVQLTASNFLQLFVHPIHWALAPSYREYLRTLTDIAEANPESVVNVCNLQPARELIDTWEDTVSENTPENAEMVAFIQKESDRCMRRLSHNNSYVGEFHETFLRTVANSSVFLYPYLLAPVPYRAVAMRRYSYQRAEDELIALGIDQFWDYVESNPQIYKRPVRQHSRKRWGLAFAVELTVKHMMPWLCPKLLMGHVQKVRTGEDKDNPIWKFFNNREVVPVRHKLLPYNPSLTLYEQPEYEMPRVWLRYLAKTSKRFKKYLLRKKPLNGQPPAGVEVTMGLPTVLPPKNPLPIHFTKKIVGCRVDLDSPKNQKQPDKFDLPIQRSTNGTNIAPTLLYQLVETSTGLNLIPHQIQKDSVKPMTTNTTSSNVAPISSTTEVTKELVKNRIGRKPKEIDDPDHCKCCVILRNICKSKQKVITDYFKSSRRKDEKCRCSAKRNQRVTNRLRLLVDWHKIRTENIYRDLQKKLDTIGTCEETQSDQKMIDEDRRNADDIAFVTAYQIKLTFRSSIAKNFYLKRKIYNLFSKFNPDSDDPILLAKGIDDAFKIELVDLFVEFLSFLTPEQAATLGKYREYFTLNCLEDLVKKVEEFVKDPAVKQSILTQLSELFAGKWSPCQICSALLTRMAAYPELAEYTFTLFPHWCRDAVEEKTPDADATSTLDPTRESTEEQVEAEEPLVIGDESQAVADYEADHSSSGEEDFKAGHEIEVPILSQPNTPTPTIPLYTAPDFLPTTCKTEQPDYDSSEMSMMIMSEDEPIKPEPPEWKRDEDKLILEVLKDNLTPEERKDKPIADILEEKLVLETLADNLHNKTIEEVKHRMQYLLNVLLLGET